MIYIPDSVFPQNSDGQALCPKCRQLIKSCSCPVVAKLQTASQETLFPKIRLETSGRHGKTVTLIEGLTCDENQLKKTAKEWKTKTGSGGTCYVDQRGGVIEIQGDHRNDLRRILNI